MNTSDHSITQLDYQQDKASDAIVPNPAILKSSGWDGMHFELHQQPIFATADHQHTMHVLACGVTDIPGMNASGVRSLDGKRQQERRSPSDIAIIPAGITHRCSWDTPAQFMVLAFEPTLLQKVGQDWVNPDQIELAPRFMSQSDELIRSIFSTLCSEARVGGIASPLLVDSVKMTLAIHLLRNYCATRPRLSSHKNGLSHNQLILIKDYIRAHLHQDLKLEKIAAIAQISPYHFLRLFKQSMGMTPYQYILQCRLEQALYLLQHSELGIAEIAAQTGFCDQSHLSRYVKSKTGITPKQLLKKRF